MTLKVRRGTDTERMAVTPEIGEPVWATDTSTLYIGDGSTAGGIAVRGSAAGVTVVQTKQQGITAIVADTTEYLVTAFTGISPLTAVTPHHFLIVSGLFMVETVDYNINAARTMITLEDDIVAALAGRDMQLVNFTTALA